MNISTYPGRFTASNATLKFLIQAAYRVRDDQIVGGPRWLDSVRYDIVAKAPGSVKQEDYRALLQGLLADRFQLSLHRDTRMLQTYELTVAKGGLKIKAIEPSESGAVEVSQGGAKPKGGGSLGRGQLTAKRASMAQLAGMLSNSIHADVQEKTGISGLFDVELRWEPDEREAAIIKPGAPPSEASTATSDLSGPSIFAALQDQLGLKLQSRKAPVEILVIDHAATPSEN
jgi:uncharacterized protein (TIGR03435 family)